MIELKQGQTHTTLDAKDAFKVEKGSADLYLVPVEKGIPGRPMYVLHIDEGETVPAVAFTDQDYVSWNFRIEATKDSQIREVEGGATRPLKKRMCSRIQGPEGTATANLEKVLVDMYLSRVISDDVLITRKESRREEDRKKAEDIVREIGRGREDQEETEVTGKRSEGFGPRDIRKWAWPLVCATLLTIVAAIAILSMKIHVSIVMALVALIGYTGIKWAVNVKLNRAAETEASTIQEKIYKRFYSSQPIMKGGTGEPIETYVLLRGYDIFRVHLAKQSKVRTGLLTAIGIALVTVTFFPIPVAVTLLTVLASAVLMLSMGSRTGIKGDRAGEVRTKAKKDLTEAIYRIEKVRMAGAVEHVIRRYYESRKKEKNIERRRMRLELVGEGLVMAVIAAGIIFVLAALRQPGAMPTGQDFSCILACGLIMYEGLHGAFLLAKDGGAGRKAALLAEAEAGDPAGGTAASSKGSEGSSHKGNALAFDSIPEGDPIIEAEDLCFSYGEGDVCRGVTMKVHKGEHLGIVGASGSGKSTLLKLLSGMLAPGTGEVRFLGRPVDSEVRENLMGLGSIVMQDDQLLTASIRDNIMVEDHETDRKAEDHEGNRTSGDHGSGRERFRRAVDDAGLRQEIEGMPMGFDTQIREDGENISAGQKQKVMIARALVRDPRIVFFDEAESELDRTQREDLRRVLRSRGITAITVSHQYASVEKCDRIIVIERGRVAEFGPPDELIASRGHFYSLMRRQL